MLQNLAVHNDISIKTCLEPQTTHAAKVIGKGLLLTFLFFCEVQGQLLNGLLLVGLPCYGKKTAGAFVYRRQILCVSMGSVFLKPGVG
ncbi:MAG: hypothetical protein C4292_00370 [Nitrososphaera sp.]